MSDQFEENLDSLDLEYQTVPQLQKSPFWKKIFPNDKRSRELFTGVFFGILTTIIIIISLVLLMGFRFTRDPLVVLVFWNGFKYSLLNTTHENLDSIISDGIVTKMLPVYPSESWPNMMSILTGSAPIDHGIVSDNFYDPKFNETFKGSNLGRISSKWFNKNPIWNSIIPNSGQTACLNLPICNLTFNNISPTYCVQYNETNDSEFIVSRALELIDKSFVRRPLFISLYLNDYKIAANMFGYEHPYALQILRSLDLNIGKLYNGIKSRRKDVDIDIIIVGDHGGENITGHLYLDDYIDISLFIIPELSDGASSQMSLWPRVMFNSPVDEKALDELINKTHEAFAGLEHFKAYLKSNIPQTWHQNDSSRVAPLIIAADHGYLITTKTFYRENPAYFLGGHQGWDPGLESMKTIFVANGPSFTKNTSFIEIKNYEIYNIIMKILGIRADPHNDVQVPYIPRILKI